MKRLLKKLLPASSYKLLSFIGKRRDAAAFVSFLSDRTLNIPFTHRLRLINQLYRIRSQVESAHTEEEMLTFIRAVLSLPPGGNGVIVEAGCFKGSSSSKFSLAADIVGKQFVIFDSFEGIPENSENHTQNIFGGSAKFDRGDYSGSLEEVRANIARLGKIDRCRFIKGWLEDTLPKFNEPISAAYLDVDLASSTRTCLKYIYPLLEDGGVLYSQDGHLPLVIDVFNDERFWLEEVGCERPSIEGLTKQKLIKIVKRSTRAVRPAQP